MSDATDKLNAVVTEVQAVVVELENAPAAEPTLADNVLAAVTPVLEAAGWTAPAPAAPPADTPAA